MSSVKLILSYMIKYTLSKQEAFPVFHHKTGIAEERNVMKHN